MVDEKYTIRGRAIIELVGKPKEHIEETMQEFLKQIEEHEAYKVYSKDTKEAAPLENSEGMFSMFTELELGFLDMQRIFNFAMDYMPASIEIEEPEHVQFNNTMISSIANDMLGKLHKVDMLLKQANQQNILIGKSVGVLIKNAIMHALRTGVNDATTISKIVGIEKDHITKFLDKLEEENKIEKDGENYRIKK